MNQKVSVIIPTKDRPSYLDQAVKSVLSQTHPVYEVLIVNDGSKSNLVAQINEIKQLSSKIKIYHFTECRGPSFARNFALDKVKGDFIIFLDDDDLIHPRMIESSLPLFEDNVDIVSSLYCYFISEDEELDRGNSSFNDSPVEVPMMPVKPVFQTHYKNLEQRPFYEVLRYSLPIHSSLIRRQSIGQVRFPEDLRVGEDRFFWLTLAFEGCRFKCNNEVNAFYRSHKANHKKYQNDLCRHRLDYLSKILHSGMLKENEDRFFVNSAIFLILFKKIRGGSLKYLINMVSFPKYIPKYLGLYLYKTFIRTVFLRRT